MGRSGNLCESSLILVGCVDSRAQDPVDVGRSDVRFSVARVVEGDARTGSVIALQASHGEGGGVSGSPYLYQDACYTLYLHATDQPFPAFQRALTLPARLEGVPEEGALRAVWRATCASYGGEIYTDDPTWLLTVPPGVPPEGMAMVFRPPTDGEGIVVPVWFAPGVVLTALGLGALVWVHWSRRTPR